MTLKKNKTKEQQQQKLTKQTTTNKTPDIMMNKKTGNGKGKTYFVNCVNKLMHIKQQYQKI